MSIANGEFLTQEDVGRLVCHLHRDPVFVEARRQLAELQAVTQLAQVVAYRVDGHGLVTVLHRIAVQVIAAGRDRADVVIAADVSPHCQRSILLQDAVVQCQLAVCQGGGHLAGVLIDTGDLEGVHRLAASTELCGFGRFPIDGDLADEVLIRAALQRVGHFIHVISFSANDHQNVLLRAIAVSRPGDDGRAVSAVAIDVIFHSFCQRDFIPIGSTLDDARRLVLIGTRLENTLGQLIHSEVGQAHGDASRPTVFDGGVRAPMTRFIVIGIGGFLGDVPDLTIQHLVRCAQGHIWVAGRGGQYPKGGHLLVCAAGCSPVLLRNCAGFGGLCSCRSLLCRLCCQRLHCLCRRTVCRFIGLRTGHCFCRSDSWF